MKNPCAGAISGRVLDIRLKFLAFLIIAALAGGCSDGESNKSASQVAARVNGHEITIHRINFILAGRAVLPEQADAAKRQVLERLIDQELAKEEALEKKLDRAPRTVQAIEAAKDEILARAYVEQIASARAKPSPEDVKKYYEEHPELFAERRIYSIQELTVPQNSISFDEAAKRAGQARDLAEFSEWLKSNKVEVTLESGIRAAEQVPLSWLHTMHTMKDGDTHVFKDGERISVVRVVASRAAPVDEALATPRIEQFLFNQGVGDAIGKEMKRLRNKSNVEYVGEFTRDAAEEKITAETFQSPQPQPAQTRPNFEKGLRGLQ